jgi:hypothetical protein
MSICSDSQVALKALEAIRTSPLVRQCQKALTISLCGMWWGCSGSLDMLGYEVLRSPTSSQGMALFSGLWDLSWTWESPDRIRKEESDVGWTTSIGHGGEVLVTPKDRLKN